MTVKILGSGCAKCKSLEENVRSLDRTHGLHLQIEKVTDLKQIMQYGIMSTPALVIDEVVKTVGKVPADQQLLQWFMEA